MLHRLEIENFYSIRDAQTIDLRAAGNAPDEPERLAPLWKGASKRAPKVVAVFGPNASGKSNVLRALSFLRWFVKDSFAAAPNAWMPFQRFSDMDSREEPTRLAVHLAGIADLDQADNPEARQCRYAYELVIGGPGGQPQRVLSEALHYWPSEAGRKVRLFERDENGKVTAAKAFQLSGYRQVLEKVLRPNASVISTLAQLKHRYGMWLWQAASTVTTNILLVRTEGGEEEMTRHYAANPKLVEMLNREIGRIDLGIRSMQVVPDQQGPSIRFVHEGLSVPVPLLLESHGTRLFLRVYPLILHALETGGIAVVDELDASIHPLILPEIVGWFHDPGRNPRNAQLWMTCQNASLLEYLIKEEVLFCDKDTSGRTSIYGLSDVQSVRRGDNYYRKYLSGVYGAVPQIG